MVDSKRSIVIDHKAKNICTCGGFSEPGVLCGHVVFSEKICTAHDGVSCFYKKKESCISSLGIVITEEDIRKLADEKGLSGDLSRLKKAELVLELVSKEEHEEVLSIWVLIGDVIRLIPGHICWVFSEAASRIKRMVNNG